MLYVVYHRPSSPSSRYILTHFLSIATSYLDMIPYHHTTFIPKTSRAWKHLSKHLGAPCLVLQYCSLPEEIQNAENKLLPRAENAKGKGKPLEKWNKRLKGAYKEKNHQYEEDEEVDARLRILAWEVDGQIVENVVWEDFVGKETLKERLRDALGEGDSGLDFSDSKTGSDSEEAPRWRIRKDLCYPYSSLGC
jgi:hypothetical protein